MPKRAKPSIAYHEACHAVVSRLQGLELVAVLMFEIDEDTPAAALCTSASYHAERTPAAQIAGLEKDIRVSLAGPVGDTLYSNGRPQSRSMREGASDDIARSQDYAVWIALFMAGEPAPPPGEESTQREISSDIADSANAIFRRLHAETKALLVKHWPAVKRVAEVLITRDVLYQDELDRLIAG